MQTKVSILLLLAIFVAQGIHAQMDINGQILYGNEWIDYDQDYYKIKVEEDGMYRISYQELSAAGMFSEGAGPNGNQLEMYSRGQLVPIYVSNPGTLGSGDYIEFYGVKNRGEMDRHLYEDPANQLNTLHSMFTDESSSFLTWGDGPGVQYVDTPSGSPVGLSPETSCIHTYERVFSGRWEQGPEYGISTYRCAYDIAEGYGRGIFERIQPLPMELTGFVPDEDMDLRVRIYSENGPHHITIRVNGTDYIEETYDDWAVKQINTTVPAADLSTSNHFRVRGVDNPEDKFRIANVVMKYSRDFEFTGENGVTFMLRGESGMPKYLEISDFDNGGVAPVLYDITNRVRVETLLEGGMIKAVLPPSEEDRQIVLVVPAGNKTVNSVESVTFTEYDFAAGEYDYIMVTHPFFFDDGQGNNLVQEYADYRASGIGGGYTPLVVDVLQLYDQFGYGIDRHEQGIKNFLTLAADNWSPKLLFFIGKGVSYQLMRKEPDTWNQYNFVPSYGYPSSDHLFVTQHGEHAPSMGVGRIAVKDHAQLRLYLEKAREYDAVATNSNQTIEDKAWMKKVLHFGGGDSNIQNTIRNRLNILKDTIENGTLGADVTSFFKISDDILNSTPLDEVRPLIDAGALMLTFFGHSAPTTLDFDLGDPNEYQNAGKYPLFYAVGCNTNRIFETETTLSEEFVFIANKGCIGFLGATWVTSLGNLSEYAKGFYSHLGTDNYGESIGEILKATITDYTNTSPTAELLRNAIILHGDPAIRLYPQEGPDYIVNMGNTQVSPSLVNVNQDSFDLELTISNIGSSVVDSMTIRLSQTTPDGSSVELGTRRVEAPSSENHRVFRLPILTPEAIGINYLNITLDDGDEIAEYPAAAESNNTASVPFFIVANDIKPISPYNFAIVGEDDPTLTASTVNVFSETLPYQFQIDTTELFNSPLLETTTITSLGGVLDWTPGIPMVDSTVYYWRVSIDSSAIEGGFSWNNHSFIYLADNPGGWNQSHYYQYEKDAYSAIGIDETTRELDFSEEDVDFKILNGVIGQINQGEIAIYKGLFKDVSYWPCSYGQNNIVITVYSPNTLTVRKTDTFNDYSCWEESDNYWFMADPNQQEQRGRVIDFLQNEIEDGDYVFFFTTQLADQDFSITDWESDVDVFGTTIFDELEAQGATQIRELIENPTPYGFIFQYNVAPKGEGRSLSLTEIIEVPATLRGKNHEGNITSTLIGPAAEWETLLWRTSKYDPETENANVDVYGVNINGEETLLIDSLVNHTEALGGIDPAAYPYLRLVYNSLDSVEYSSPQLDYWRVHYTPLPEAALAPNKLFSITDSLQQGESFALEIAVENIGEQNMDSMLMHYTIIDGQNNQVLETQRTAEVLEGNWVASQLNLDTRNMVGDYQVVIEANPNHDQPELYHYNNIGLQQFFVGQDMQNPLLDVTFDGVHIIDGDLVDATPEIIISLLDENPFLELSDTALLEVYLTTPDGTELEQVVDGETLVFYPATSEGENKARMEFRPTLAESGVYQLQVRGRDVTGNPSGTVNYRVNFEIILEESITNILNYPNPFTTSTRFVYTLTGDEMPDEFRIQIMTVSGKVVKEIDLLQEGEHFKVGDNMTDYRWDGTDEYGDRLANGVYLYRVVTKVNGEQYDKRDNGTDGYFKKGLGKMVLMR